MPKSPFDTSGPSTVLPKLKQPSTKQIKKNAKRVNYETPLCAFIPPERAQKIRKAQI
jgi:hypothetical protein